MWITSLPKYTHINNYHQQCWFTRLTEIHTLIIIINSVDYKFAAIKPAICNHVCNSFYLNPPLETNYGYKQAEL